VSEQDLHEILLPPEREGHAPPPDLAERRAQMDAALASGAWAVSPPPEEIVLGGRRTLVFRPEGVVRGRMIHFHGGAFRLGGPEMEGPFAVAIAAQAGFEVYAPQYRLAPEHPFPAGLNDGWAALAALAGLHEDGLPLVLSGDSAGGGLAASLAVMAAARGLAVDGLVLLSPWLDLTVGAAAYAANAGSDPLFSRESAEAGARLYTQGFDRAHPLVSPVFADLRGLPRTLISVGAGEVLRDDAHTLHRRLGDVGVVSELFEVAGMDHVAVVRSLELPGAGETLARIVDLLGDIAAGGR